MAGFMPAIHVLKLSATEDVDGRDKPGHDRKQRKPFQPHLIASGLVGEPTAPVIGIAGATNMNS